MTAQQPTIDPTTPAQQFYGRWARLYDLIARRTPGIARIRRQAAVACGLDRGDTVVEMGCGTGANLHYLREEVGPAGTVIGIDFTGPVLKRARASTAVYDNVHVVRGDATAPPIAVPSSIEQSGDDGVDAILATFVVGMLDDPADAVDRWCALLSPEGHLVLVNAMRSDRRFAPVINAVFRAIVVASTPPTKQLRYESDPVERLDARVTAAHDRLRLRSNAVLEATALFGIVRLLGGQIA